MVRGDTMYTIQDIKELIRIWYMHDSFGCKLVDSCENCRKYNWCDADTFMLSLSYLNKGEYYG